MERIINMDDFFRSIWDKREDFDGNCYCYETGRELPFSFRQNRCCYHHVLAKSVYPEYKFEEWNIVILHPDTHTRLEGNLDFCPKVKALTEKLKKEYGHI